MIQHIYVARHGQSEANAKQLIAGQRESPLTTLGEQQALQAAQSALQHNIDLIVSSPMQRARRTAEIIAGDIGFPLEDIQIVPELTERYLGELEGKQYTDMPYGSGNTIEAEKVPQIESIERFYQRVKTALETIHNMPGNNVLIVCHNGTGRMLFAVAQGYEPIDMYSHPRLENGIVYPLMADQEQ